MQNPISSPECFAVLYDPKTEACQSCLLLSRCGNATASLDKDVTIPVDTKVLLLSVLRKFGIRVDVEQDGMMVPVTEDNLKYVGSLHKYLTSREALIKLFTTRIAHEELH